MKRATRHRKARRDVRRKSPHRLVCRHLLNGTGLGFYAVELSPEGPLVLACCKECAAVVDEERGWSERAEDFAGLQPVCPHCDEGLVRKHRQIDLTGAGPAARHHGS